MALIRSWCLTEIVHGPGEMVVFQEARCKVWLGRKTARRRPRTRGGDGDSPPRPIPPPERAPVHFPYQSALMEPGGVEIMLA